MKKDRRNSIKKITLCSILSALAVVLIFLGSAVEMLDITVASVCSLIVYISMIECGKKYSFLVYWVASVLAFIFTSTTTTTLYFIAFFGYYPILKYYLRKLPKPLKKTICAVIFNVIMALLMLIFKAVFGLKGEPYYIYILLLLAENLFFFCFDYLLDVFYFIYLRFIRSKINFKF